MIQDRGMRSNPMMSATVQRRPMDRIGRLNSPPNLSEIFARMRSTGSANENPGLPRGNAFGYWRNRPQVGSGEPTRGRLPVEYAPNESGSRQPLPMPPEQEFTAGDPRFLPNQEVYPQPSSPINRMIGSNGETIRYSGGGYSALPTAFNFPTNYIRQSPLVRSLSGGYGAIDPRLMYAPRGV